MATSMKAYIELQATASNLVNEVGKAQKSLGFLEQSAKRLQNTLVGLFAAEKLISGIQTSVMTLAEFDKTMTAVKVITGSTNEDFQKLEKAAISLGSSTQYTAKQVGELQLEFGRLGFSTKEILDATKATIDLATATGEGLARSAEIAGSTLRAFQLDSKEMGRVTDVMAASLNSSALTLDTFADGIKYVSPVAKATGVSLEETAAMMSVLADAGIKGSQAGTSLRRIFTLLTNDGKPLQQRLKELADKGITLADANDEVGLYAQTALLQLTAMLPKVNQLTEEFRNSAGATEYMARAMENNLGTAITKVGTAWDALILSFRGSNGFIKSMFDGLADTLNTLAGGSGADLVMFARKLEGAQNAINDGNKLYKANLQGLIGLAEKLGKDLNIIYNQAGQVTGIYETLRGPVIGPDPKTSQIVGLQAILDYQKKSIDLNKVNAEELKKQNEEYQKLIKSINELGAAENKREMERIAMREFLATRKVETPGTPSLDAFTAKPQVDPLNINDIRLKQEEDFYAAIKETIKAKKEEQKTDQERIESYIKFGQVAGNVLSNVISSDREFGASIKKTVADLLRANAAAIASFLALKFAKDSVGKPLPLAVAGLTAAIGVVAGLLGKDWKKGNMASSSYRSGQGYERFNGGQSESYVRIKGQDLYVAMSNFGKYNQSTTFGG